MTLRPFDVNVQVGYVTDIDPVGRRAEVTMEPGNIIEVPLDVLPAKSARPRVGERWILHRLWGASWVFAAVVAGHSVSYRTSTWGSFPLDVVAQDGLLGWECPEDVDTDCSGVSCLPRGLLVEEGVQAVLHWSNGSADAGDVRWRLEWAVLDDEWPASDTEEVDAEVLPDPLQRLQTAFEALTLAEPAQVPLLVAWRVERVGTEDTCEDPVYGLGIEWIGRVEEPGEADLPENLA